LSKKDNGTIVTPENIEVLRVAKEKLEKDIIELKNLSKNLEKEHNNYVPPILV
jgi:hypothetical protein